MMNETEQIKKKSDQSKGEGESTTLHDQNDESVFFRVLKVKYLVLTMTVCRLSQN